MWFNSRFFVFMFSLYRGKAPQVEWYPKVASTAYPSGGVVQFNGTGQVANSTAATATVTGVQLRTVASTDSDFASATFVPVVIPDTETEFLADVTTGTLTTAMVGSQFDLTDDVGIDVTATVHKAVLITQFISGTLAVVKFTDCCVDIDD